MKPWEQIHHMVLSGLLKGMVFVQQTLGIRLSMVIQLSRNANSNKKHVYYNSTMLVDTS